MSQQTRKRNYRIRKTIKRAAQLMHQLGGMTDIGVASEQAQLAVKSVMGHVSEEDQKKISPAYAKQARNALGTLR